MKKPFLIEGLQDKAILKNIYYNGGLSIIELDTFNSIELAILLRLRDQGFLITDINHDYESKLVITYSGRQNMFE